MDPSLWCPAENTLFSKAHRIKSWIQHTWIKWGPPEEDSDLAVSVGTARERWTCTEGDLKFLFWKGTAPPKAKGQYYILFHFFSNIYIVVQVQLSPFSPPPLPPSQPSPPPTLDSIPFDFVHVSFTHVSVLYAHSWTDNAFVCISQIVASSANLSCCWVCHPKPYSGLDHGDPLSLQFLTPLQFPLHY